MRQEIDIMKWTKKEHKVGDERTVKRFAWRPTRITNTNIVVWLESYYSVERLLLTGTDCMYSHASLEWIIIETQQIGEEL